MSYRTDSEVTIVKYHRKDVADKREPPNLVNFNQRLNGTVAVVSNCNRGPRNRFFESLASYYPVDIYGRCRLNGTGGSRYCNNQLKTSSNVDCNEVVQKYKFYLAVENSLGCQDYITEKYWRNAIGNLVLPVVMGATEDDFDMLAIPKSYLHAESADGFKDLASRLTLLSRNYDDYLKYFEWMKEFSVGYDYGHWCKLCTRLNGRSSNNDLTYRKYLEFDEWFNSCPGIYL
ncbi:hypothetical protein ACOME3_002728 [Neoechinorhynchus agilis]